MKRVFLALLATALVACATPYHERGWANLGVDAAPMGGDVYRVQARLNIFSDQERVEDFLMMRSAETAQQNGALGFEILGARDTSENTTMVTPGSATTTASVHGVGNSAYGSATTTYTPARVYDITAPGGIMMIRLVRETPPEGAHYFNAAEIIAAVGPRVR